MVRYAVRYKALAARTHFPSSPIRTFRIMSVCPARLATCFFDLGSKARTRRLPEPPTAMRDPDGGVASE